MRERFVMIGQAPSRTGDPRTPCVEGCFKRLAEAAGAETRTDRLRFYARFVRFNVFATYRGRKGRGDRFPMAEARDRADGMRDWLRGRTVLLVGKNVARAFRINDAEYFEWTSEGPGERCVVVPHPSGINRWWNKTSNRERARLFFSGLFPSP